MKSMLRPIAYALAASLALPASCHAFAAERASGPPVRTYAKRPSSISMPTGCAPGEGPQYQSFSPALGRIVREARGVRVDFNPTAIARRAALVCTSDLSGQATCQHACAQLWVAKPQSTGNRIDDPQEYAQCVKSCPGVPTFARVKPGKVEKQTNFYPNATR